MKTVITGGAGFIGCNVAAHALRAGDQVVILDNLARPGARPNAQWLSSHHQPGDRALSSPGAGQLLPAWAGVSVYVGHYSETLDYFQKIRNVGAVLKPGEPDTGVRAFLHDNGITLLYWGPDETLTGFQPASQCYLEPIHQEGAVTIYRVHW